MVNEHSALSGDENLGELDEDLQADQELKNKIMEMLEKHVEVDSSHVKVSVKEGFVSLTGSVFSLETEATIKTLVENVEGVQDVVSLMDISDDPTDENLRLS